MASPSPVKATSIDELLSEFKTLRTKNIAEEDARKISDQLLLQRDANWGDLLSAAPRTLCSIGQCFVIAWSEGADKLVQEKDTTIAKYLRTNLVDCSDLGREEFREAESKMNRVSTTIQNIIEFGGVIDGILDLLSEDDPTTSELNEKFARLERLAKECEVDTEAVVKRSKIWQEFLSKITNAYAINGETEDLRGVGKPPRRSRSWMISMLPRWFFWNRMLPHTQENSDVLNQSKRQKSATVSEDGLTHTEAQRTLSATKRIEKKQQDDQPKFAQIEGELRKMNSEQKATKERVSKILRDCQENLAELHKDTEHLRVYFHVLHDLVKFITKHPGPIESTATSEVLSKEQITDLRADITKLCVHYTIAGEISSTYVNVSRDYIMPGVNRVDSLSKTSTQKRDIDDMIDNIATFSKKAQDKIHGLAAERREILRSRLLDFKRTVTDAPIGERV